MPRIEISETDMKKELFQIIEISFVIIVTTAMLAYGVGKYVQFSDPKLVSKSVSEMTGMELMWAFYGYSKAYAILIGIAEVTGGILLAIRKTRLLGGILLTGILMNIILQDVFYGVNAGALRAAIIYQVMIAAIIWMNRSTFINGIRAMLILDKKASNNRIRQILIVILSFALAVLLKFLEFKWTH